MINLGKRLKDENFKVLIAEGEEVTLGKIISKALIMHFPQETESMQEKDAKFRLWLRIVNKEEIDLKSEQITLIKNQVSKAYPTFICGQACAMIEGEDPLGEDMEKGIEDASKV